ncbi:MAG: LacI family DNA-binding transcriptional regulator [Paludibacteraceae bacterium]
MKNFPENITIKEIARLAGVSAGTVDRVLHHRGKVSTKNLEKINEILQQVDYHPNIIASALASNKKYHLAAVIPLSKKGEYWELVSMGIDEAINEFSQFGMQMQKIYFDQYDSASMKKVNEMLLSEKFDGVILAVLFKDEFALLSDYLAENEIPFMYMDFNLRHHKPLAFYGTDSLSGGKLSARMLLSLVGKKDNILIVLLNAKNGLRSNQSINRENGFLEYLKGKIF